MLLERAGIPAVPIITDAFEPAAREMAELWGVPGFRFVTMAHPLAYLTADEIDRRAEALLDKVLRLLQQGQPD